MRLRDPEWVFLFLGRLVKLESSSSPTYFKTKPCDGQWGCRVTGVATPATASAIIAAGAVAAVGLLCSAPPRVNHHWPHAYVRTYVRGTGKVILMENAIQLILWFGHSLARQSSYQNSLKHSLNSRVHTAYRCTYAWKFKKQSAVQFLIVVQNCTIVDYSGLFWIHIR